MVIDIKSCHVKGICTAPKSENLYLLLLVKLYRFLAGRTDSNFNKVFRIQQENGSKESKLTFNETAQTLDLSSKIVVQVGTVTDDIRLTIVPKITAAAVRFTKVARDRIVAAGGKALTLDQLALRAPTGSNTVLLRDAKTLKEAYKHFGIVFMRTKSHT